MFIPRLNNTKLNIFQGGTATITVKNIPDGVRAMYYVYDYSQQCGTGSMSFKDTEGQATIYGPNGSGWFFSFD